MTINEAFEARFKELYPYDDISDYEKEMGLRLWNAAAHHYEREIAELKADNKIYAECNETIKAELATELKRVSSYKTLVNSLEGQVSHYSQKDYSLSAARLHGLEQSLISEQEMNETLTNENFELQASNNKLREALDMCSQICIDIADSDQINEDELSGIRMCEEAIDALIRNLATPAESLQAFENDVIEKCARHCECVKSMTGRGYAEAIRALKEVK